MTAVLNPPPIRHLAPAEYARLRARLAAEIAAPGRIPSRPRRWRLGLALSAISVAVVAVLAANLQGRSRTVDPVLAATLRRVSAAALRQPDVGHLGPGQYLYVTYSYRTPVTVFLGNTRVSLHLIRPEAMDWWLRADGSGRLRTVIGRTRFATPADRRHWIALGRPRLGFAPTHSDQLLGSGTGTCSNRPSGHRDGLPYYPCGFGRAPRLPSEPAALYTTLLQQAQRWAAVNHRPASEIDAEMFSEVYDLIANPLASARQKAAGYAIVARIPGVRVLGRLRDPLGRVGLAIGYPATGEVSAQEFLFDPHTYRLLDQRETTPSIPGSTAWEMWHGPIVVDGLFQTGSARAAR